MSIAFKGKVIYIDDFARDQESPLTFAEMINLLNNKDENFEFRLEEKTNETVLTITRIK